MSRAPKLHLILGFVPLLLASATGCSEDCTTAQECGGGEVCYQGTCTRPSTIEGLSCNTDVDCNPAGGDELFCQAGRCVVRSNNVIVPMVDSGVTDGGPLTDGAMSMDTGVATDSGVGVDTGGTTDGGAFPDTGVIADAGIGMMGTWAAEVTNVNDGLYGVWAAPGTSFWAVGAAGRVLRNQGGTWGVDTSTTTSLLRSVWGRSDTDLWAVGDNATFVHRDANGWTATATAVTAGLAESLYGVHGYDDGGTLYMFAVGSNGTAIRYQSGVGFSVTNTGTTETLNAVQVFSGGRAIAVGGGATVLYYDGAQWTSRGGTPPQGVVFHAVWGNSPTDFFAAGSTGAIVRFETSDYTTFSTSPLVANTFFDLWGGSVAGANTVFAVGAQGTVARWTGSGTTFDIYSAAAAPIPVTLRGIDANDELNIQLRTVGDQGGAYLFTP